MLLGFLGAVLAEEAMLEGPAGPAQPGAPEGADNRLRRHATIDRVPEVAHESTGLFAAGLHVGDGGDHSL